MAQDFYSLEEMAPRFGVDADVFIKAWLDERLPLYIHFGSDSLPCTIRRCIPMQLHEYARDDILYGRDLRSGLQAIIRPVTAHGNKLANRRAIYLSPAWRYL